MILMEPAAQPFRLLVAGLPGHSYRVMKAGCRQQGSKIARDRRLQFHARTGDRMREREPPRVERLPGECAKRRCEIKVNDAHPTRLTVGGIADNRPSAGRQVCADLMGAAGNETTSEQRKTGAWR